MYVGGRGGLETPAKTLIADKIVLCELQSIRIPLHPNRTCIAISKLKTRSIEIASIHLRWRKLDISREGVRLFLRYQTGSIEIALIHLRWRKLGISREGVRLFLPHETKQRKHSRTLFFELSLIDRFIRDVQVDAARNEKHAA